MQIDCCSSVSHAVQVHARATTLRQYLNLAISDLVVNMGYASAKGFINPKVNLSALVSMEYSLYQVRSTPCATFSQQSPALYGTLLALSTCCHVLQPGTA